MNTKASHKDREYLKHLSAQLARIHKGLMDDQMNRREILIGEKLLPGTKLQLLIGDPEFEWLRTLSQLMTLIDDAYFQKEPLKEEQIPSLKAEVQKLLIQQTNQNFAFEYNQILKNVSTLKDVHQKLISFLEEN